MKNLNENQLKQLINLEGHTNYDFTQLIKQHVNLLDNDEFNIMLEVTTDGINDGEGLRCAYDENFCEVASRYEQGDLYMDELGRGLNVSRYEKGSWTA